jgi:hypothetical protein
MPLPVCGGMSSCVPDDARGLTAVYAYSGTWEPGSTLYTLTTRFSSYW